MPKMKASSRIAWVSAAVLTFGSAHAQILDTTVQAETEINDNAARSQQTINQISDQTEDLITEYRQVLGEIESLQVYNERLETIVGNQRLELSTIEDQLERLESTNRGAIPLIVKMVDMLEQVIENDLPFMMDERRNRVADLRDIIDRADVTTSEKYRRVMESYQVEMEYGRQPFAYQGRLEATGRQVNFLRVGRVLLLYQTLDGETTGWYNPTTSEWETLGDEYRVPVDQALRIARNQAAPDLVKLPVPGPETAQ